MKLKRLFMDVETTPNLIYSWRTGAKQYISWESIVAERQLCSLAWAWNDGPIEAIPWMHGWGEKADKRIAEKAMELWRDADEIVGHNIQKFDANWLRTRAVFHRLGAMPDVKLVDTLRMARSRFFFNSNTQDYISRYLNGKAKLHTDFQLWKDVMAGDQKALARMVRYNKRDVSLLRQMYKRMEPYCLPSTHAGVLDDRPRWSCPYCGSMRVKVDKKRATAVGYVKYQMYCHHCQKFYTVAESVYKTYQEAKA